MTGVALISTVCVYKHTVGFIKPFIIFKVIHFLSLIINTLHANQILNAVLGNNQGLLFWVRKNVLVKMIDIQRGSHLWVWFSY